MNRDTDDVSQSYYYYYYYRVAANRGARHCRVCDQKDKKKTQTQLRAVVPSVQTPHQSQEDKMY